MEFNFSNREIAVLSYLLIAIVLWLLIKPKAINDLIQIAKILICRKFCFWYLVFATYLFVVIFFLKRIDVWSDFLWKDFWIWFLTIGLYHFYNLNSLKSDQDFKKLILKTIAFVGFVEFTINFYTFDLLLEFLLIPFLVFISLLRAVAVAKNFDNRCDSFIKVLNVILTFTGLIFILNSIIMTFYHYDVFFSHDNMKSFLLPIFFTILFLPMLYFASFWMKFELILVNLNWSNFLTKTEKKAIKRAILFYSFLNLDKLDVLAKYDKAEIKHTASINLYFKSLLKK